MSGFHQTWNDPAYPTCPVCEAETDDDRGWCSPCNAYAWEHPEPKTLEQWVILEAKQSPDGSWGVAA